MGEASASSLTLKLMNTLFGSEVIKDDLTDKDLMKYQITKNAPLISYFKQLHHTKKMIFIKGNVPSLKNSKEIIQVPTKLSVCCKTELYDGGLKDPGSKSKAKIWKCGECNQPADRIKRHSLVYSKTVQKYIDKNTSQFQTNFVPWANIIKDHKKPFKIGLYYVRDSLREFDYNNASHIITDLMKEHGWIEDDSCTNIKAIPLGYHVNKEKPGCVITLMDAKLFEFLQNL